MNALHQGHIKVEALDPSTLIQKLGDCLEASMGGTMGACTNGLLSAIMNPLPDLLSV